ncbi:MAG: hydrogenase maturation protease [Caldilineaceae bacterium]
MAADLNRVASTSSWLVIGYGNSLRRDDGAGLLLAASVAADMAAAGVPVRLVQVQQLAPELAEEIAAPHVGGVIFVDTTPARAADDTLQITPLGEEDAATAQSSSHHVGPGLLLRMAAQLFGHAPAAWLVTVPGWDFDHGEALSPSTRAQLARAAAVWPHVRRQADL